MTEAWPLHREHPVEYPEGASPLGEDEARELDAQVDRAWQRDGTRRLSREFPFGNFRDAFGFATRVALLAEREFHHPELTVTWGKVLVRLWTHTVETDAGNWQRHIAPREPSFATPVAVMGVGRVTPGREGESRGTERCAAGAPGRQ